MDENLLRQVVTEDALGLPIFTETDAERFFDSIHELLENRAINKWKNESFSTNFAVFVLAKYPRKPFSPLPDNKESSFDLNANHEPVFGKIFF